MATAVSDIPVTEAVIKYFFYFCFDEKLSFTASLKVLADLKAHNWLDSDHRGHWIRTMHKYKTKLNHLKPRTWTESPLGKGILLPMDFDISVWVAFLNAHDADDVEAVLLSRILGFTDLEIGEGLDVTMGTVRYRVGHGLRHLGGYIES